MLSFLSKTRPSIFLADLNIALALTFVLFACFYADLSSANPADTSVSQAIVEGDEKKK